MAKKPTTKQAVPGFRSVTEIQQEYTFVASQLGSAIHRMERAPSEIETLKKRLAELDIEGETAMKRHMASPPPPPESTERTAKEQAN